MSFYGGHARALTLMLAISNTTAYPRSYSFGGPPSVIYPFQSNLARIDTAVVFVTKYSREGYDLTDLKVSSNAPSRTYVVLT